MSVTKKLQSFVKQAFKTTLDIFLEALRLSPNARGYISGSVTELLLKKHLEGLGFEVKRIREKWEGKKHPNHKGDFYVKKAGDRRGNWYVVESKGVKSNSEKWHKLYNYGNLKSFLFKHHEMIAWIDKSKEVEPQITAWLEKHLPKFFSEYASPLYDYEEVENYSAPQRATTKSEAIAALSGLSREEIAEMIRERLDYVMRKIKVLETHFVSGLGGEREQNTPRKDEFNIISVDIFLRHSEHKFLFANPHHLESSSANPAHIQQNYVIGFIFNDRDLCLSEEWGEDFGEVLATVKARRAVNEADMQVDYRIEIDEEE